MVKGESWGLRRARYDGGVEYVGYGRVCDGLFAKSELVPAGLGRDEKPRAPWSVFERDMIMGLPGSWDGDVSP